MSDDKMRKEAQAAKNLLKTQNADTVVAKADEKPLVQAAPSPVVTPLNTSATVTDGQAANAEVEKLKAELQKHRVEEGRLKKTSEELAALREEREAMKKRLDELEARSRSDKAIDHVSPDRRKVVDEDVMKGAADVALGVAGELEARLTAKIAEVEQRVDQGSRVRSEADGRVFDQLIEQAKPGFIASTNAGGQLCEGWGRFLGKTDPATGLPYEKSLQSAYQQRRLDGVNRVIDIFLDESGVARRGAVSETLAPSASVTVSDGPTATGDKAVYTMTEANAALDKSRRDFESGQIDSRKRNEIILKIQTAIAEGRVVRDPNKRAF
jgi:hypothetical protein